MPNKPHEMSIEEWNYFHFDNAKDVYPYIWRNNKAYRNNGTLTYLASCEMARRSGNLTSYIDPEGRRYRIAWHDLGIFCDTPHDKLSFSEKADILRDVFDNPFHLLHLVRSNMTHCPYCEDARNWKKGKTLVTCWQCKSMFEQIDPWLSDTSLAIARSIYHNSDFASMPILADALEESSFPEPAVIEHLRQTDAPHTRYCWALRLLLGQEFCDLIKDIKYESYWESATSTPATT